MHIPYDEPSPHPIKVDGKKYRWIRTVQGKSEAEKIKKSWKKMGNLVRIIPADTRGYYKIYSHLKTSYLK